MANVTPAGPLSVAIQGLAALIANVPAFQTWTGTANATDAAAFVFTGEVGYAISSVTIAAGVLTITTRDPHLIAPGAAVEITGATLGSQSIGIAGINTVTAATANSLTFATALGDLATVYPDFAFVIPCVRPLALVSFGSDPLHSEVVGTGGASILAGTLEILLEADVSQGYQNDAINSAYEAANAYGSFIQGLMATQGTGDLMCLNDVQPVSGPEFTANPEQDDNTIRFERWRALVRVPWGIRG